MTDHEQMACDVLIVGAGPAGLACAISLLEQGALQVYILEKGSAVGSHIISGAVMDPSGLDALLPDWREDFDQYTSVVQDRLYFLTKKRSVRLPLLPGMNNVGNAVVSLSQLTRYLANKAEELGAEILVGYSGSKLLEKNGKVIGVQTSEVGLNREGLPGENHQMGIDIHAKQVVLAEGARGFLSEQVIDRYKLRTAPQTYGLGVKEVWRVKKEVFRPGHVVHTVGWPLSSNTYGGGFIYHGLDQKVMVGVIVGLDAPNPTISPFHELQRLKHHPKFESLFAEGTCVAYGARCVNEGGYLAIPTLNFPGGVLVGCAAGFLNIARIKGIHAAIYSGIEAAKSLMGDPAEYNARFQVHPVVKQMYRSRNVRPSFRWGLFPGMLYTGIDQFLMGGRFPWTLKMSPDHEKIRPLRGVTPISYPKPDGVISFDVLTQLRLSNTHHREDQPGHLILRRPNDAIEVNYNQYGSPEQYYCPANVYEVLLEDNKPRLQINASNCLHCKACSIRDPGQNIIWALPEPGGGPGYQET